MHPEMLRRTTMPQVMRSAIRRRASGRRATLSLDALAVLADILPDHHFGGAHRHAAGEAHDVRDVMALRPARGARMAAVLEGAENGADVVFDPDVRRQLDLDVPHERMQRDLRDARGEGRVREIQLDV